MPGHLHDASKVLAASPTCEISGTYLEPPGTQQRELRATAIEHPMLMIGRVGKPFNRLSDSCLLRSMAPPDLNP